MKKRGRGRPRKSTYKGRKREKSTNRVVTTKLLGYCKCGFVINRLDFESVYVFVCPGCGERQRRKDLKKEGKREIYESKKEYLEGFINAKHIDMPPTRDNIPSDILKKFEDNE